MGASLQLAKEGLDLDACFAERCPDRRPAYGVVERDDEEVPSFRMDELPMAPALGRHGPTEPTHGAKEASAVDLAGDLPHLNLDDHDAGPSGLRDRTRRRAGIPRPLVQGELDRLANEDQGFTLGPGIDHDLRESRDGCRETPEFGVLLEDHLEFHHQAKGPSAAIKLRASRRAESGPSARRRA